MTGVQTCALPICSDAVNGEMEPHLQCKRETTLGFALHLTEWIARCEKVCVQVGVAGRLKIEITALVCGFERATHQIAATPDMSRPRNNQAPNLSDSGVGLRLEVGWSSSSRATRAASLQPGEIVLHRPRNASRPLVLPDTADADPPSF